MDVTPLIRDDQQIIQSYAAGQFKISGISYAYGVIVSPDKTVEWVNAPQDMSALSLENFQELLGQANDVDVVLFGTGNKMHFVSPKLRQALSAKNLPVDIMDTGAACRTYNVLMAEGRRVVAIMMVSE